MTLLSDVLRYKRAILFCLVSSFGALCYGYDQIYYTGLQGMRPFINDYGTTTDSEGRRALTTTFLSLTASIIYVGELLGALCAAPINDYLGRKGVFYIASVCIIVGAITQATDKGTMRLVILGRILIGLGVGQFTVTCLLYIGEVAPPKVRGPALMCFQLMQSCSQLVGSGITQGTETLPSVASYKIPMALLALLPLAMIISLPFIPESPIWYMRKGREQHAEKALRKINKASGLVYDPAEDMRVIHLAVQRERANNAESTWISLFREPAERRKLLYSCGAMVAQQMNGIQFFYSYGVVFAQSIGIKQAFTISLITNVLQLVAVAASVGLGNRVPRRGNLLITTIMMWCAFILIGGLGTQNPLPRGFSIGIVVVSYVIICAFNFGHGCLAYAIAAEMAAGRNRNKIMSCAIVTFFFTVWVISFTSPYIYYDAGFGPMLGFVYAGTTLFTLTYVWFCVGETTGRSNLEIELFFQDHIPVRKWATHIFAAEETEAKENVDVVRNGSKGLWNERDADSSTVERL